MGRTSAGLLIALVFGCGTISCGAAAESTGSASGEAAGPSDAALAEADVILFIVDGKVGPQPDDETIAAQLRRRGRPVGNDGCVKLATRAWLITSGAALAEMQQLVAVPSSIV